MKKIVSILILLCLTLNLTFAEVNDQKIYSVDSDVYKDIVKLYLVTGHAMPSTTGPWSGDELANMVNKLEASEIPSYLTSTYESVVEELNVQPNTQFEGGVVWSLMAL